MQDIVPSQGKVGSSNKVILRVPRQHNPGTLPRIGSQRGLPTLVLLSPIRLELAGHGQGSVYGPGEHRFRI